MEKDSVLAHFAAAAVAALAEPWRSRVLAQSGVPADLLAQPHARVPARAFAALWLAVARELDDEFFGLDSRRMKVGSFALLAHAALSAGTLDRATKLVLRGFGSMLDDIEGALSVQAGEARVTVDSRITDPLRRRFAHETFLTMVHGLASWLVGRRLTLLRVEFAYPRPSHVAEYAAMFSNTLAFDAATTAMVFDARLLALPVMQDASTVHAFLREAPQSVFVKYRNASSLASRVRRRLRESLGRGESPGLDDVARELRVAPTTLRRHLDAEGTSWRDLKDRLRLEQAMSCLRDSDDAVTDIAHQLGFQDASTFHRAFKRWCGLRPGEYRRSRESQRGAA